MSALAINAAACRKLPLVGQRAIKTSLPAMASARSSISTTARSTLTDQLSCPRFRSSSFKLLPHSRPISNMASQTPFLQAVAARHSNYALKDTGLPISDARIKEIVETTIKNAPSSFNAQSTRLVVLLKDEHKKFWDFVLEVLQPHITADTKERTEGRINGFRAGYGSILFFEDPNPVNELKKKFPQYEDRFEPWSEHTSAIHQFILWTALDAEGLGANLQHYNPLVDTKVKNEWKVPGEWSLKAQLVFGALAGDKAGAKDKLPTSETVFVHGA